MILHVGGDKLVRVADVVAILDREKALASPESREFLKTARDEGFIVCVSPDPVKSYVIAEEGRQCRIYASPITSTTLLRRSQLSAIDAI